jgi:hypothetical protein
VTRQHQRNHNKARAAVATAAKQRRGDRNSRSGIPATISPQHRLAAVQAAAKTRKDEHMSLDKEQIVEALAQLSDDEAKQVIAEARGQAADPKHQAAQALRDYLKTGRK